MIYLYSKPGCSICESARGALSGARFEEIDITGDPGLYEEYATRVPVVESNGQIVWEAGMDTSLLAQDAHRWALPARER